MKGIQEMLREVGEIVDLVAVAERSDYVSKTHKGRPSDEFMNEREQLLVAICVCRESALHLERAAALSLVELESDTAASAIAGRDLAMLDQYSPVLHDWLFSYEKELDASIDAIKKQLEEDERLRDSLVYKAKFAEQAERFDEMVADMKEVARQPQELTVEERNLLSVAYKNAIGSRRASWHVVSLIEQEGEPDEMALIKDYKAKIEAELVDICNDILSIIEDSLIPNSTSEEAKVFYYKMKGDYHRYLSEFQVGEARMASAAAALDAYQAASALPLQTDLPPTHPIRLGLALNVSVFHYEILNSPDQACQIAKQAFDDAIAELDTLNEESYKDSTLIMQFLRDNLTLWTSDQAADAGGAAQGADAEEKAE